MYAHLKLTPRTVNDPFDYEQKYPDDEPYTELSPMARIWKVFLDECAKFDAEMVEDWRDALDVLLVFVCRPSKPACLHTNNAQ